MKKDSETEYVEKGMSEATYHIPVMLEQAIEGLNINPNGVYVDLTFGGGGHSRAILDKLSNEESYMLLIKMKTLYKILSMTSVFVLFMMIIPMFPKISVCTAKQK